MNDISPTRSDAFRRLAKAGRRRIPIATLGILSASALTAFAMHSAARSSAPFALSGAPTQQAVAAGSVARYQISLNRRSVLQSISMSVSGAPRHAQTKLTSGRGLIRLLAVTTSASTPTGRYRLVVSGRYGNLNKSIRVGLTVVAPKPVSIGISGNVGGLEPGTPQPLDLTLRNPSARNLSVTRLTVTATSVSAPRSTALLPCTPVDFSMQQFSGAYPLALPASSTRTLWSLGVPPAQWPQVTLLNLPVDQDGCQGASVTLSYSGKGVTQ